MTFGSTFGRVLSPTFQAKSQAVAGNHGWWDLNGTITSCVAAYQPKGAASYAASKVNLANPGTYNATDGAAYPSWETGVGWTHNGTSQYLDSGILATAAMSVLIRFDNATTPANGYPTIFGSIQTDRCLYAHPRSSDGSRYYRHGDEGASVDNYVKITGLLSDGVIGFAGYDVYENATLKGDCGGWDGTATQSMYIGCRRESNGTPNYWFAGDIVAMAFFSDTLTSTQVGNLTTAMNAL